MATPVSSSSSTCARSRTEETPSTAPSPDGASSRGTAGSPVDAFPPPRGFGQGDPALPGGSSSNHCAEEVQGTRAAAPSPVAPVEPEILSTWYFDTTPPVKRKLVPIIRTDSPKRESSRRAVDLLREGLPIDEVAAQTGLSLVSVYELRRRWLPPTGANSCGYCSNPGHNARTCPRRGARGIS
jgi:hypothetical protein